MSRNPESNSSRYRGASIETLSVRNVSSLIGGLASTNPASPSHPTPTATPSLNTTMQVGCEGGPTAWDSTPSQHPSLRAF